MLAALMLPMKLCGSAADSADPQSWPRQALIEARRIAVGVDDPYRRAHALEQTAVVTTRLGDRATACGVLIDALQAARGIGDRSIRDLALRGIAVSQTRCDDVSGALHTLEEMTDPESRDTVRTAIVEAQVAAGQLDAASTSARGIESPLTESHALRRIAVAHARSGHFGAARAVADEIPDNVARALTVADIGALHADVGNAQAIESARLIARGVRPTAQREAVLGYVAAIQAQSGDVQGALSTAASIKGPATRAHAIARIVDARLRANDTAGSAELLHKAVALARSARPGDTKAIVLCEIAETFILAGDKSEAQAALEAAYASATSGRSRQQESALFEVIARTQARAGDIARALATAERAPPSARALLVHDILAAQAEAGDEIMATTTARSFRDPQLKIAGLVGIVGAQTANGNVVGANQTLGLIIDTARTLPDTDFRAHSLGAVAAAQVRLGNADDGWSMFQEAVKEAESLADPYARALAYVNLSDPFTQR
jgi:tetratricopeptide (TPR) repeat protein